MRLTRHAQSRVQQRCVSTEAIELALDLGIRARGRGGANLYRLDDRHLRNLGPAYERMRGVTVVESDEQIITVWKNAESRRRGNGRRRRETLRLREIERALRQRTDLMRDLWGDVASAA